MSTLCFKGSRRSGTRVLCRRHHDLSGVDYEYIGSLPDLAVDALEAGQAEIRVQLRDDFEEGKPAWRVDVLQGGNSLGGCYLSDDTKEILLREQDRIPVFVENEEIALATRDLQIARSDLKEKERMVEQAQARVEVLEARLAAMSLGKDALVGIDIAVDDRYRILSTPTGGVRVLRYGEDWRDIGPDSPEISLIRKLSDLTRVSYDLGINTKAYVDVPSGYGLNEEDILRIELDGGELRQTSGGRVLLTLDGRERDITGDKFVLSIGYQIEELIAHIHAHSAPAAGVDEGPSP